MGDDPGFDRSRVAAPSERRERSGEVLLGIIASLMRESQPGQARLATPRLDSRLDRDLGFDSLARVELLLRIERAFDVRLSEHLLGAAETPGDLLRAILAARPGRSSRPAPRPSSSRPPRPRLPKERRRSSKSSNGTSSGIPTAPTS